MRDHANDGGLRGGIRQFASDIERGPRVVGGKFARGDNRRICDNMDTSRLMQPDIAIQSAAGIPTRGIGWIVEMDGDEVAAVFVVEFQIRSKIDTKGGVTVSPAAGAVSVDPNGGVGHRAFDFERDEALRVAGFESECLAIPCLAPPTEFSRFAGKRDVEPRLDTPVMRKIERAPSVRRIGISKPKLPILVEKMTMAG